MLDVSVVMSVYNGADKLSDTLDSVLEQEGCDLEFIVVNDGSTDSTRHILDTRAASDQRLHVIHQENVGLTRALICGCAQARGKYIARQDAGDISLPSRLSKQIARLNASPECVAVSCDSVFMGAGGEFLYQVAIREDELNERLLSLDLKVLRGPSHHGSVMMRRAAFEAAGAYRENFYFAQDLDLWTRLAEHGRFAVVEEVLYQARLEPHSISGIQTVEQRKLSELILAATNARRSGKQETHYLQAAYSIGPIKKEVLPERFARCSYFIGCCLKQRDPVAAAEYFYEATRYDPMHWRAWLRLAECKVKSLI